MSKSFSRFLKTTASRAVLAASLAAMAVAGEAKAAAEATAGDKWSAYIDLEGELGEREKGEVNAFLPVLQDRASMMFLDLRGKLFSESEIEGNFGLGYRQRLNPDANIGVYGFFDVRQSEANNTFYQVTAGAEYLTRDWDLRGNLYIPVSHEKEIESSRRNLGARPLITGGNLIIRHGGTRVLIEEPLWGVDGEVGYRVPGLMEDDPDQELRVFAGAFYFDASEVDALVGPKARLEYRFYDVLGLGPQSRITLGAEGRWDDERDTEGFVSARLRIPLQPVFTPEMAPKLSEMDRRMLDPIERDVDIVTQTRSETRGRFDEMARDLETGRVIQGARVLKGGGDASDLANRLGEDSLIVVDGRNGPVDLTDTIVVADGTKVVGGGTVVDIEGVRSGQQFAFQTPGTRGTLSGPGGMDTLQVGSDTILRSFDLDGGNRGLVFNGASNGLIQDVTVSNTGGDAVSITGGSDNLNFMHVGVNNAGGRGIFADGASNLFFDDVHVDTTGSRGFDIRNTMGLSVYHTTVANTGSGGFITTNTDDVMVENISVSNTVGHGLRFSNSRNVTVNMASVMDADQASIMIDSGSDDVTIRNATIDGSGAQGVLVFNGTSNVTFDGLSVANTAGAGIVAQDTQTFVLRSAQIMDAGGNGIFLSRATGATLEGLATDNAGGDGLRITNSSDVTVRNTTVTTGAGAPVTMTGLRSVNTDGLTLENLTVSNVTGSGVDVQGDNAAFDGVMVSNAGNVGIRFEGADSQLSNLMVDGAGSTGVLVVSSRNVDVDGVMVRNATTTGFAIDTFSLLPNGPSRDIRVSNVDVAGAGTFGVRIGRGTQNVVLDGLRIANSGMANVAVSLSSDIEIRNAMLSGSTTGLSIDRGTRVTARNLTITDTVGDGIADSNSQELFLRDSTVMNAGGNGVFLDGTRNSFLSGLRISNAEESGIHLMNTVNIGLQDTVITSNAGSPVTDTGLRAVNSNSLQVRGLEVSNTTGNGVDVSGVNNDLIDVGVTNAGGSGIRYQGTDGLLSEVTVNGAGSFGLLLRNVQNVSVTRSTFSNVATGVSVDLPIFAGSQSDRILFSDIIVANASSNGMALFNADNVVAEDILILGQSTNGLLIESTGGETFNGTRITVDAVTTDSALNFFGPDANIQVTDVVLTGSGARAISLVNSMNIGGDVDVDTSGYATVCRADPTLGGTITGSLSLDGLNGTTPPATCP